MYYDQFKKLSKNHQAHLLRDMFLDKPSFHYARRLYDVLIADDAGLLQFAKQAVIITGEYGDRQLSVRKGVCDNRFFIEGDKEPLSICVFTNGGEDHALHSYRTVDAFIGMRTLALSPMFNTINEYQLKGMSINYCGNAYSGKYASKLSAIVLADEVLFEAVIFALQQNKELTDD